LENAITSLTKIALAFDNLLKRWRACESQSQFDSEREIQNIIVKDSVLLRHVARTYTISIFKLFLSEYANVLASTWTTLSQCDNSYL